MQATRREGSALRSPGAWIRFLGVAAIGTAADLATKAWAARVLTEQAADGVPSTQPVRDFLPAIDLLWQRNYGAVFGVGQGATTVFVGFAIAALALLVWLFADSRRSQWGLHVLIGLIVAGAVGNNLYDRLKLGYVRDFLRFNLTADWVWWGGPDNEFLWPYVFNVADVFISVGVVGLFAVWLWETISQYRARRAAKAQSKNA